MGFLEKFHRHPISVPTYLTYTKWVPCEEEGSGSSLSRIAEDTLDFANVDDFFDGTISIIDDALDTDALVVEIEEEVTNVQASQQR